MLASQDFMQIEDVREGVIVMKSKALRGVLMTSSLNFALKSGEEQTATINQFQDFLNTLDFPCQILIQSRRLNITGYIENLKELEQQQTEELMKIQTTEYRKFIENLVGQGVIMSKKFFIVVPFTIWESKDNEQEKGILPGMGAKIPSMTEDTFQRCKTQLWQRMEFVALGLRRCGLQTVPLRSTEIIELLWGLHHPEQAEVGYFPEIPPELIK